MAKARRQSATGKADGGSLERNRLIQRCANSPTTNGGSWLVVDTSQQLIGRDPQPIRVRAIYLLCRVIPLNVRILVRKNSLFLAASQFKAFWTLRRALSRAAFEGRKRVFGIRTNLYEKRMRTATLYELLKVTVRELLFAVFVGAMLQLSQSVSADYYKQFSGLTVTADVYATLLATVAGMGAVLIGLYYAATTAIGGAIYARVPNNIRELLVQERVGNVYMRYLAFLTYVSVILLAFRAAGFPPIEIAIPLMVLASGVSLVAFVLLGARAFDFFDPTSLSYDLFAKLRRNYLQIASGGYRWSDAPFQSHAHRNSDSVVETLVTLGKITSDEKHLTGRPFATLCKNALVFLILYEPEKKRIPTESRWYPKRLSFPDWYKSADYITTLGRAASRLNPEQVSNPRWIEQRIIPIVHECLQQNLEQRRYDLVIEILGYVDTYVEALAKEHEVETAFEVVREIASSCESLLFAKLDSGQDREPLERLAVIDALARLPISIFLSYLSHLESNSKRIVASKVPAISWETRQGIYKTSLPLHLLKKLEYLKPRIEFEVRCEGHRVSPNWYLTELIAQAAAENMKVSVSALFEAQTIFEKLMAIASSNKLGWLHATILDRESEYWAKVEYQFEKIQRHWADLASEKRIEGLPWPKLPLDKLEKARGDRLKRVLELMAKQAAELAAQPRPDGYPDFPGQFLHAVGDALLQSMCDNQVEDVKNLFPKFAHGSWLQFDRLRAQADLSDWRGQYALKIAVAPLLDLMDLSGYCILMGELHGDNGLSEPIHKVWNFYFDNQELNPKRSIISILPVAVLLTEGAFELPHRSQIRFQWKQTVQDRLRKAPRKERQFRGGGGYFKPETVIIHESPLVRLYGNEDSMIGNSDGIDIFIERVLLSREDGTKLDFSRRRRELRQRLERQQKREAASSGSEKSDDEDVS